MCRFRENPVKAYHEPHTADADVMDGRFLIARIEPEGFLKKQMNLPLGRDISLRTDQNRCVGTPIPGYFDQTGNDMSPFSLRRRQRVFVVFPKGISSANASASCRA